MCYFWWWWLYENENNEVDNVLNEVDNVLHNEQSTMNRLGSPLLKDGIWAKIQKRWMSEQNLKEGKVFKAKWKARAEVLI